MYVIQQYLDDVAGVLVGCKEYIRSLLKDTVVNQILGIQKSRAPDL